LSYRCADFDQVHNPEWTTDTTCNASKSVISGRLGDASSQRPGHPCSSYHFIAL
jgi:hypothetical protein